jgi:hypothetical protein
MNGTAYVVETPGVAKRLNRELPEPSRAYSILEGRGGARYDEIVLITSLDGEKEHEWFEEFRCCLKPGGEIVRDW